MQFLESFFFVCVFVTRFELFLVYAKKVFKQRQELSNKKLKNNPLYLKIMITKEVRDQFEEFTGMRFEVIDLNYLVYFYMQKRNRLGYVFTKTNRSFMLEELIAIRYLENGIILHLTNLDDDKNSRFSFRRLRKIITREKLITNQDQLDILNNKIDLYRKDVNSLKNQHRNKRIAHANSLDFPELENMMDFETFLKPLVQKANELGDFLFGESIQIKYKLGSYEGILDFRKLNEELVLDLDKNKGI